MATQGLTTIRSSFGPEETMNRFEAEVRARGMIAFAHIDHAAGAAAAGLSLRPTELLIFGNARGGTPLMDRHESHEEAREAPSGKCHGTVHGRRDDVSKEFCRSSRDHEKAQFVRHAIG
jgi:hypothetical protein